MRIEDTQADAPNEIQNASHAAAAENTSGENTSGEKNAAAFRSGFASVVGRPSVGKSTLINAACGAFAAITSPYPQTTRSVIRAIVNRPSFQIVLLDTPGIHKSSSLYNSHMNNRAVEALSDCDVIVYMVDLGRAPGEEEARIARIISRAASAAEDSEGRPAQATAHNKPSLIIAQNKTDAQKAGMAAAYQAHYAQYFPHHAEAPAALCALKNEGVEDLLLRIAAKLPEHPPFYPREYYTDQSPEFRICEIVRGEAIALLRDELPHALYTRLMESSVKSRNAAGEVAHLFARVELVVEAESQQGIVVGRGGSVIRAIRLASSKKLAAIFPYALQLELRVSVDKKWRRNAATLHKL